MSLCPACGAVRGKGRFAVPYCCRGTDPPPLRRAVLWPSREAGREGRSGTSEERIENREELWCAALRHGFGKGCLGEDGGKGGQFGFRWGRSKFGAKKKPGAQFGSRPRPVAGAVSFDRKLYGITKKGGGVCGEPQVPATHRAKRKSPPQRAAFGIAKCLGTKRKRHLSVPFSFGAEDGTRTHTPKYWLLRPERLPFRHFRLFHFGPAHSQNSRPTSTRIIPFLALPCQFPGLSPPFGGCLSTGVVLG